MIVVVTWGFFSAKSRTLASASTMSFSIGVLGECGRGIDSVKNAGSSCAGPQECAEDLNTKRRTVEGLDAARMFIGPITLVSSPRRAAGATGPQTNRASPEEATSR